MALLNKTMASKSVPSTIHIDSLISPYIDKYLIQHDFPQKYTLNPALYMEEIEGYPHKWNDRFHPSSDLKTPERQLYDEKHPKIGPTLQRAQFNTSSMIAMQVGTAMHALFEAVLIQMGMTTKEECEVYFKEPTLGISGLCDIKRLYLPDKQEILVDIKSCSKVPAKLDPWHALQVAIYIDLIPDAPKEVGSVLYLEKSYPHRIADFPVYQKDMVGPLQELYTKWGRVREAIKNNDPSGLKSL